MQPQAPVNLSDQQVAQAAGAGLQFLSLDTTLIPGNMRQQLAVLEVVLQGIASGNVGVVSATKTPVESGPDTADSTSEVDDADVADLTGDADAGFGEGSKEG